MFNKKLFFYVFLSLIALNIFAQDNSNRIGQELNAITTGVPFLMIAPDARAGAMGDAGVATSPDPNSIHWNPAKYAFINEDFALNVSYIPWLRNLVSDINFANISGSKRVNENQVFGFSLMYFSLGDIAFTDGFGERIRDFNPNEFSLDAAYALKFSKDISGGVALRYVHSNLTGGIAPQGQSPSSPGNVVSGDVSVYYTKDFEFEKQEGKKGNLAIGLNISNLGTKISYGDESYQEFIPANIRLGAAFKFDIDEYNSITATVDVNKLLVPTNWIFIKDSISGEVIDTLGVDPDVSVPVGVFQSFMDAPGGFEEELHEIMYSFGLEYWYNKTFAVRMGYFYEHLTKGNRKYFTTGVGIKLNVFAIDFAYLITPDGRQNPLANTLRFTLGFNFNNL